MRFARRPALLIVAASIGVHAGVLAAAHVRAGSVDAYAFRSLDAGEYYRLACNLAVHGVFSQSESTPLEPHTWRTPGYPLFLSAIVRVFGESPLALVLIQQMLSVLNVWLVFTIARGHMTDRRAAVCAAVFLFEPYHLFYSLWLLATTLFVTVLLLTWIAWRETIRRGTCRWALLLGGLSGFAVLVRPVAMLVPFVIGLGLFMALRRSDSTDANRELTRTRPRSRALGVLSTFAVACAVVVGSWMMRNRIVADHFALSDQSGVVVAYFKAAEVELWREGRTADRYTETSLSPARANDPHVVWDGIDDELRQRFDVVSESEQASLSWRNLAQGNRTKLDSFEVSRELSRIGGRRLLAHPLSTATCYLARCLSILTFPLNLALKPPSGNDASRWRFAAVGALYLVLVLAVAVRLARGGWSLTQVYFPLATTIALLIATTPQVDPRFRAPMMAMLVVLAFLPIGSEPRTKWNPDLSGVRADVQDRTEPRP